MQSAKEEIMNRLVRIVPLAGVVYLVLEVAGNGSIGDFPDSDTAIAKLIPFYASHHAGIARGGFLLHYAALALALFLVGICARAWQAGVHAVISGALLVGAAVTVAAAFAEAGVYSTLGFVGAHQKRRHTRSSSSVARKRRGRRRDDRRRRPDDRAARNLGRGDRRPARCPSGSAGVRSRSGSCS